MSDRRQPMTDAQRRESSRRLYWSAAGYFTDRLMTKFAPAAPAGSAQYLACWDVLRLVAYLTAQQRPGRLDGLPVGAVRYRLLDATWLHGYVSEALTALGHVPADPGVRDPVATVWRWLQGTEQWDEDDSPLHPVADPETFLERGVRAAGDITDRQLLTWRGGWQIGTPIRVIGGGPDDGDEGGVLCPLWAAVADETDPMNLGDRPPVAYRVWLLAAGIETDLPAEKIAHRWGQKMPSATTVWSTGLHFGG